jgi:hypothetical protein
MIRPGSYPAVQNRAEPRVGGHGIRLTRQRGRLHGWTHFVPLGCFAVLGLGAIAFLFGVAGVGLYFVGRAIGVLIIAGTRNIWELLVRAREHVASR